MMSSNTIVNAVLPETDKKLDIPSSGDDTDDDESLSVTSSLSNAKNDEDEDVDENHEPDLPEHVPVFSERLDNGNLVFMEDREIVGTLVVPHANLLCAWFSAMRTTNIELYKKYRFDHLQAQDFKTSFA